MYNLFKYCYCYLTLLNAFESFVLVVVDDMCRCMAAAAYRVYDFEKKRPSTESPAERLSLSNEQAESEAVVSVLLSEQTQYNGQLSLSSPPSITQSLPQPLPLPQSNFQFSTELVVKSVAAAAVVKYGELFFDFPFSASDQLALAMVTVPELYLLGTYLYLSTKLPSDDNTSFASNNNANII